MGPLALENLHVLITGAGASVSREVARQFSTLGASVTAIDPDVRSLSRLHRDVSLYRAKLETAAINPASASELRSFEDHLRLVGRLPQVQVCCCPVPGLECVGALASRILQPSLFLHAEPARRGLVGRTIDSLRRPTLLSVLGREPGRGLFSPHVATPFVRIAGQTYSLRRQIDLAANDTSIRAFPARRGSAGRATSPLNADQANAA
jgi:hypothetical protein